MGHIEPTPITQPATVDYAACIVKKSLVLSKVLNYLLFRTCSVISRFTSEFQTASLNAVKMQERVKVKCGIVVD
jgi:hypothetical protein